ncbi:hypothetical protein KIW84_044025 [Lathyrus oleraceus]|uniref:Retrotransposon gag domain-containing protein n=1 Tax=Pisum sativum TaxID=3888 RepID=A0A9D4XFB1_PEA|nr:hypothetical protein KIW84_044025 [Pisum sativum]
MPFGLPWGMPSNFVLEGYQPVVELLMAQPVMLVPPPMVHDVPYVEEHVFHADQSETIPHKFKVPDFEKYKGNSYSLSHLVMYTRKMSTQTNNDQLLIHYFQDNLIGAALKWYMGLDNTQILTFNDPSEAFVHQYKFNIDMEPYRDQLSVMSHKHKETFKEYVQRWCEVTAHVSPLLEEKEMTKLFLKTLRLFYYDHMVASAPSDFTEMKNLVQIRTPPAVPEELLWWYKLDRHCAFHQVALGHDIKNYFALKAEVRRLMQSGIFSFEDSNPNVQFNT